MCEGERPRQREPEIEREYANLEFNNRQTNKQAKNNDKHTHTHAHTTAYILFMSIPTYTAGIDLYD